MPESQQETRHKELMSTLPKTKAECIGQIARVLYEKPGEVSRAWVYPVRKQDSDEVERYTFEVQITNMHGNTSRCDNDFYSPRPSWQLPRLVELAIRIFELAESTEWQRVDHP